MEFVFQPQKSSDYKVLTMDQEKSEEFDDKGKQDHENLPGSTTVDGAVMIVVFATLVITHSAIFLGDALSALVAQLKMENDTTLDTSGLLIATTLEYTLTSALSMIVAVVQLEYSVSCLRALSAQNKQTIRHWDQIQVACAISLAILIALAYTFNAQDYLTGRIFLISGFVHIIVSFLATILVKFKWM